MEEQLDNEEAYWFVRWIQMRRKYKTALVRIAELEQSGISKLVDENNSLKAMLTQVKEDYTPIKKVYKGKKR